MSNKIEISTCAQIHEVGEADLKRLICKKFDVVNPKAITPEQLSAIASDIETLKSSKLHDTALIGISSSVTPPPAVDEPPTPTKKRVGRLTKAEKSNLETQINTDIRSSQQQETAQNKMSAEEHFVATSNEVAAQQGANDAARMLGIRMGVGQLVYSQMLNGYSEGLLQTGAAHAAQSAAVNIYELAEKFSCPSPDAQKKAREETAQVLEEFTKTSAEYRAAVQN